MMYTRAVAYLGFSKREGQIQLAKALRASRRRRVEGWILYKWQTTIKPQNSSTPLFMYRWDKPLSRVSFIVDRRKFLKAGGTKPLQKILEFYSWKYYILVHLMRFWTKFNQPACQRGSMAPCPPLNTPLYARIILAEETLLMTLRFTCAHAVVQK